MAKPTHSSTAGDGRRPSGSDVGERSASFPSPSAFDARDARDAFDPTDAPDPSDPADPIGDLVAALLEAAPDQRALELARIEVEDATRARRIRSRLAALGDLGMSLDAPRRMVDLPTHFGEFRRLQRAGAGGMGEVYLARHEATGELAAIKLVRPDHLWFEKARERFRREVEATSQLSHPDIVRVLAVGEERGVPWLAMEWVGGASLEHVLERLRGNPPETLRAIDFEDAVRAASSKHLHVEASRDHAFPGHSYVEVVTRVAARVAGALAHAHSAGVLHRDVKPANVMVTPAGRVLLTDFGLALPRGADRMTRTGSWLGSLPYAAPEQIEGSPRMLDRRADVYSLGATLYELVTLRTPFLGGPESRVRRRIATGDFEPPRRLNPALPPEIERVCVAALDHDPRRRPNGGAELADDLVRAVVGERVHARATPTWLRVQRWARRRPKLAAATAAIALVVLGSIAMALRERALAVRFTRLADLELVRGLHEEARDFWPAARERIQPMQGWLARAGELLAHRVDHRRAYDELTLRALPYSPEDRRRDQAATRESLSTLALEIEGLASYVARGDRLAPPSPPDPDEVRARDLGNRTLLEQHPDALIDTLRARVVALRAEMQKDAVRWRPDSGQLDDFDRMLDEAESKFAERATYRFADSIDAWRHDALRRLLEDLDRLALAMPRVRAQLDETRRLEELASGESASLWERARASIAASPRYGGLSIEPVFGLIPLDANGESGLWEFLLAESGEAPRRDAAHPGRWLVDEASGVVLVLLPGGRFTMGQRESEGPPRPDAVPLHEVALAPFFMSRFELTAAQAERLGGFPPEKKRPEDGRLPLAIDWDRARAMLVRHGLELPTEAQWEYAARADSQTPFVLEGFANVADRTRVAAYRDQGSRVESPWADFDDGFANAAPVGSFRPNAFGLHDMVGNIAEWCLDYYVTRGYSTLSARAGDGLRATVVSAQMRVVRGGCFSDGPLLCSLARRLNDAPGKMSYTIGVRPVRRVGSPSGD
jgi:serine/threonine protein kinase/formylglycine-generating enzyme required for sulfatase activity